MRLRLFIVVVMFVAFLAPLFTPLAYASVFFKDSHELDASHYCEVSNGPCKHGDACPLKEKHHHKKEEKKERKTHGESKGTTRIAATCHDAPVAGFAAIFSVKPFPLSVIIFCPPLTTRSERFLLALCENIKEITTRRIERPPQTS